MEDLKDSLNSLTNTSGFENLLLSIAYWVAILAVILLVFYIFIKLKDFVSFIKNGKKDSDDFL